MPACGLAARWGMPSESPAKGYRLHTIKLGVRWGEGRVMHLHIVPQWAVCADSQHANLLHTSHTHLAVL